MNVLINLISQLGRHFLSRRRVVSRGPDTSAQDEGIAVTLPRVNEDSQPGTVTTMEKEAEFSGWKNALQAGLLPGFPVSAEDVVLDLGCGDEPMSAYCAPAGAAIILADIDEYRLRQAFDHVATLNPRSLAALVTDSSPLPLADASMSRIIATEVFEHVVAPERVMRELVRVGIPGALYLLSVPDPSSENLQRPFAAPAYFEHPNHIRIFERDAFDRLPIDAGLEIVHKKVDGFFLTMWWCLFWACQCDLKEAGRHPLLASWTRTWEMLLATERGPVIKEALDQVLPKRQTIIARKRSGVGA
jgi:ubiquinone/menaquinone biosynthesis C-methylase UbiE